MLADKLRPLANAQAAGITYVGGTTASSAGTTSTWTASLTSLTGGSASSPSAGDLVLVFYGNGSTADNALTATGYTEVTKLYSNDSNDTNLFVGWKIMGSTPDTSVTLSQTFNAGFGGAVVVQVWRNVDPYLPVVEYATATAFDSVLANPPSITPTITGSFIVAGGAGGHIAGSQTFSSSDLTAFQSVGANGSSTDSTVGAGYKEWTSGSFDPAAFTYSGTSATTNSWAAVTLILIPDQKGATPPEFIASANTAPVTNATSLTINKPSGTAQGDLMIALVAASAAITWTGATGWTEIADQGAIPGLRVAYKIAGASEGTSYTFTASSTAELTGAILTYRAAAYDAIGTISTGTTSITATGPTAATTYSRMIGFAARNTKIAITSNLNVDRVSESSSTSISYYVGEDLVLSGATGTRTFTMGSSTPSSAAVLLTIKPA